MVLWMAVVVVVIEVVIAVTRCTLVRTVGPAGVCCCWLVDLF